MGSGTLAGDLGGITIWNPWSNESDTNLEDSACTVRVLLFFPMEVNAQYCASKQTQTAKFLAKDQNSL